MTDAYVIIREPASAELKVKGSRFLAESVPVEDEETAEVAIKEIRKREYAATHHCSAYRVGPTGDVYRYNDDGEPSGTAGPPILRQIEARELTNTLVVVTRYYGGTKLGTGGLMRAYSEAASLVLDATPVRTRMRKDLLRVRFQYSDTSPAMYVINRFDADVRRTRYTEQTELLVAVRRSAVEGFVEAFVEALCGRGDLERVT